VRISAILEAHFRLIVGGFQRHRLRTVNVQDSDQKAAVQQF
jgi:hypothetical protein